jgi:hypothetical protein
VTSEHHTVSITISIKGGQERRKLTGKQSIAGAQKTRCMQGNVEILLAGLLRLRCAVDTGLPDIMMWLVGF